MGELYNGNRLLQAAEGLQILATVSDKCDLCAEHDIIYAGGDLELPEDDGTVPRDVRLTEVQQLRLHALGWDIDRESNSWAFFV